MLSEEYVAGLFDGEGCVTIARDVKRLRIGIANTNKEVLVLLADQFGGHVYSQHQYSPTHSPAYQWILSKHRDQRRFLRLIGPHSLIKATAIHCALRFLDTGKQWGGDYRINVLSSEEWQKRRTARDDLYIVNADYGRRGDANSE